MQVENTIQPRVIRTYSPEERANALALYDNLGNLEQVSNTLGIAKSTLHGWLNDPNNQSNLRTVKGQELAQKFENAANLFLDLAVKKSRKAEFNHLMTGAGIAIDKMQLLRGQPTNISENIERNELTIVLQSALSEVIDVTPEHNSDS
jgi:transposase-like protein